MSTNKNLIDLEHELEADLAEAQRHIELGRRNAIDELNRNRESLGELCGEAGLHIDLLAYDADDDLKRVRSRLAELTGMLAKGEISDLETFDTFRDRFLEIMSTADADLDRLNKCGAEWGAREQRLREAWAALSRQLELARRHLLHETQIAKAEFECERDELATHLEETTEPGVEAERPQVDFFAKVSARIGRFVPGFKRHAGSRELEGSQSESGRGGARHD